MMDDEALRKVVAMCKHACINLLCGADRTSRSSSPGYGVRRDCFRLILLLTMARAARQSDIRLGSTCLTRCVISTHIGACRHRRAEDVENRNLATKSPGAIRTAC